MKRAALLVLTLFAHVAGCAGARPALSEYHHLDLPARSDAPVLTADVYDDLVNRLRTGDIILGVKEDAITAIVRLVTVEPSYYTHTGAIEIIETVRNGRVRREARIWHAIGDFKLLHLSPHLLGKVRGGVRTISLEDFIRRYDNVAIVRLPDERKNRAMIESCRRLHEAGIQFDPFMDCEDPSRLCCTELTAETIREAGYDYDIAPAPRTTDAELSQLLNELNITTPAIYMAGQFERLAGAETVAIVSRYGRLETYLAMRAAAEMLHGRMMAGALRAREIAGFDRRRMIHFTPRMELFLRGVEGVARAEPTSDAAEIRRRNEVVYKIVFGED